MPDIDKIIKAIKCRNGIDDTDSCTGCHYFVEEDNKLHHVYCNYQQLLNDVIDALELLKEREERLRKLQKDKDKLCLEVSEWKHKFHDAPPKFVSQGVVDQICWERDTALSQLEQIGKGLGSKMDDIVALLKEQEAVEPTLIREGRNKYYNDYVCPRCDNEVVYEQNYCSECGIPFLWKGR